MMQASCHAARRSSRIEKAALLDRSAAGIDTNRHSELQR
jgi:hypothetical protein